MNQDTALRGWNGLQPPCGLTGEAIQNEDYIVWFPYFITDKKDPFWRYNEWPMLRKAFDEWEHKEAFLARWRESLLTNVALRTCVLVNQVNYLVLLVKSSSTIALHFLAHGFALGIPRARWSSFRDLLLKAPRHSGEFHLPSRWRISVRAAGDRIRITWEPLPTSKGRRDQILLDQSEWKALKEVLQEIDLILKRK